MTHHLKPVIDHADAAFDHAVAEISKYVSHAAVSRGGARGAGAERVIGLARDIAADLRNLPATQRPTRCELQDLLAELGQLRKGKFLAPST